MPLGYLAYLLSGYGLLVAPLEELERLMSLFPAKPLDNLKAIDAIIWLKSPVAHGSSKLQKHTLNDEN